MKKYRCIQPCYFNHRLWSPGETINLGDKPELKNFEKIFALVSSPKSEAKPETRNKGDKDGQV